DGPVYDVDFFMKGSPGAMTVTETSVHKINGQPLYAWEQKREGTWRRVPVEKAPLQLLGVVKGTDEFDFVYRATLPEIPGAARIWIPLASSDAYQRVDLVGLTSPREWVRLDEAGNGNQVLFFKAGPADSHKAIEVRYRVKRSEKSAYAVKDPFADRYL